MNVFDELKEKAKEKKLIHCEICDKADCPTIRFDWVNKTSKHLQQLNEQLLSVSEEFKNAAEVVTYVRNFCKERDIKILKIENYSYSNVSDIVYFTVHTQIDPSIKYWGAPFTINLRLTGQKKPNSLTEALMEFQKRDTK